MARRTRRKTLSEINIVPYIDVMLVLLVIFMITTPLLSQGVKVNLPQAKAKALSPEQNIPLIVSVDAKGRFYLNKASNPEAPLTSKQLVVRIAAELSLAKEKGQHPAVLVKGDKDAEYGQVVGAMVLLQHAGVNEVGLMTKDPQETQA